MSPIIVDANPWPTGAMSDLLAAAIAQLEDAWDATRVHQVGAVPKSPEMPYAVVSVSGGASAVVRNDGTHAAAAHRIIVQCVGRTAGEVGFALDKATGAYSDVRLPVPGYDTTPASAELDANITRDPDGGALLTVTQTFAFHAYPA